MAKFWLHICRKLFSETSILQGQRSHENIVRLSIMDKSYIGRTIQVTHIYSTQVILINTVLLQVFQHFNFTVYSFWFFFFLAPDTTNFLQLPWVIVLCLLRLLRIFSFTPFTYTQDANIVPMALYLVIEWRKQRDDQNILYITDKLPNTVFHEVHELWSKKLQPLYISQSFGYLSKYSFLFLSFLQITSAIRH